MKYRVYIEPPALADVDAIYLWLRKTSLRAADAWLDGMGDAIDAVARMPSSYALAPESMALGIDIREMHYGRAPHIYRAFFVVRKHKIHVLHIRHAAQQPLTFRQLQDLQSVPLSKRQKR